MEPNNIAPQEPIDIPQQVGATAPEQPKITFGHQPDGSYLTPFNTTYFYREDFFQSCLAGLIDRVQAIVLSDQVDWKTLHEMPQFITPHVVIFDSGAEKIPLADLVVFASRGFQRVIVYSDRIDDYAADYIELVAQNPSAAKAITVNNVDLFFDTFITSGSAFTIVLVEDLLRDRYGKRMDIEVEELEETKFFMRGIRFGRDDKEAVARFLKIAAAGYRMGERRAEMVIRGQALEDSLHYYARTLAQTALTKKTPHGNTLIVWINSFLLKSLHKPLLEQLIMRAADSDTDFDFALCLHPINDKISAAVMPLGGKTIPPYNNSEITAGVFAPADFAAWWPGVITTCVVEASAEEQTKTTQEHTENTTSISEPVNAEEDSAGKNSDSAAETVAADAPAPDTE